MPSPRCHRALLAAALCLSAGCAGHALIATPNVLRQEDPERYFAGLHESGRSPTMEVLYATDRAVLDNWDGPRYGAGRSKRLAFGTATVTLDPTPTWPQLAKDSTAAARQRQYVLRAEACREAGTFDPLWDRMEVDPTGIRLAAEARAGLAAEREVLYGLLRDRLAGTAHKDVFLFIHGFNNTFDDAVFRAAETWHFLGRVGVPLVYSWPAGHGGPLGYLYDRESGEFTVFHLKQFLRTVAACPGVERVHIVAHSRGADVAISALRELHISYQSQGKSTRNELKLENLVLAAPDLDEDVFLQRFVTENLLTAAGRTTIYSSRRDFAIELADLAFGSRRRLGQLGSHDFSPKAKDALARLPQLQFVDCRVSRYSTSHDYLFAHPAALSDLIRVLRDRRPPGAEYGRPLIEASAGIWELTNDYLLPKADESKVVPAAGWVNSK